MLETTLSQLRQLKLNGMASAQQTQRDQPGPDEGLAFTERLQLLAVSLSNCWSITKTRPVISVNRTA